MATKTLSVAPLIGSNYNTWKLQCQGALMRDGLWGIVAGSEPEPVEGDLRVKYQDRKHRALGTLILTISTQLHYVLGNPTPTCPRALWLNLEQQFQRKSWPNISAKRKKLHGLRMTEGESVEGHMKALAELMDELSVIDTPIKLAERSMYLLESLPPAMDNLVTAMTGSVEVPAWDVIAERLRTEEAKQKSRGDDRRHDEEALTLKKLRHLKGKKKPARMDHKGITCFGCNKKGHFKSDCPEKEARPSGYGGMVQEESSSEEESDVLLCHALAASPQLAEMWIVDSGATSHMCKDRHLIKDLKKPHHQVLVKVGDGSTLEVLGVGTVTIRAKLPSGRRNTCQLQKVLYIPELSHNLFSVRAAGKAGKTISFNGAHCRITQGERTVISGSLNGELYVLDLGAEQLALTSFETWHRRFGHLGKQNLRRLQTSHMVTGLAGMKTDEMGDTCKPCLEGRQSKNPFPQSSGQASKVLDLVHSDVCGQLGTTSMGGAEYFVSFIDSFSHYTWTFPIKKKSEVFGIFKKWQAAVENETGRRVKVFRTDGGGEFTSTEFSKHLTDKGIKHEITIPRTPEQNGVAERMNRTLLESVRSLLSDSGLPKTFWGEALNTATYLRNRAPSSTTGNLTPTQRWTGKRPDVSHFRVFGCRAFAHQPAELRGKLDPKTQKCLMMGYAKKSKGYRLFNEVTRKIIISRNVIFNETEEEETMEEEEMEEMEEPSVPAREEVHDHPSRNRNKPVRYGEWANLVSQICPHSHEEAVHTPEATEWREAMDQEMKSLKKNQVWDLTPLPTGKKAVGSRWVFKLKTGSDGNTTSFKARLVAQGFSQRFGADYDETFSPVVRMESVRTLIAVATQRRMELHQVDVTTAFLNGILQEEVYMRQPEGYQTKQENLVCKLRKSIYGLKQSPRCWNAALDTQLRKMDLIQSDSDPCIYTSTDRGLYIGVYVDDIILAGEVSEIQKAKEELGREFAIKDLGRLSYFLGITVQQTPAKEKTWMGQPAYVEQLLEAQGMSKCKAIGSPAEPGSHLVKANETEEETSQQPYQSLIGSLLYLSNCTRPDIAFSVGVLAKFSSHPTKAHWTAAKRVLRYLQGTCNYGVMFESQENEVCRGYSDADWAGDREDRRSTSGYVFQIGLGPVSWRSRKQTTVALSTAEAEYVALASAAQEAVWLRKLHEDLGYSSREPTTILEDNQSAIAMAKNPQFHGRAKHIDIRHHFVRELVEEKAIQLVYCASEEMIADLLTKGLTGARTLKIREMMGVHHRPTETKEEVRM